MNGLAFPSPAIRYLKRFGMHTCPNQQPIPTSGWAGSSSVSGNAEGVGFEGEKALRSLISILFPNEGSSLHCYSHIMFVSTACSLSDVCGIFLVHGAFSVIAVAMGLLDWFDRRMRPPAAEENNESLDALRSQISNEQELLAFFSAADKDGSGLLEKAELELVELLKSICHTITPKEIEHAASILDVDGDNCVSFAEFVRWWKRKGHCE
jgi:hypothetical protein